ncbi:hypothetical protein Emed_006056 [Eimeria media]
MPRIRSLPFSLFAALLAATEMSLFHSSLSPAALLAAAAAADDGLNAAGIQEGFVGGELHDAPAYKETGQEVSPGDLVPKGKDLVVLALFAIPTLLAPVMGTVTLVSLPIWLTHYIKLAALKRKQQLSPVNHETKETDAAAAAAAAEAAAAGGAAGGPPSGFDSQ